MTGAATFVSFTTGFVVASVAACVFRRAPLKLEPRAAASERSSLSVDTAGIGSVAGGIAGAGAGTPSIRAETLLAGGGARAERLLDLGRSAVERCAGSTAASMVASDLAASGLDADTVKFPETGAVDLSALDPEAAEGLDCAEVLLSEAFDGGTDFGATTSIAGLATRGRLLGRASVVDPTAIALGSKGTPLMIAENGAKEPVDEAGALGLFSA